MLLAAPTGATSRALTQPGSERNADGSYLEKLSSDLNHNYYKSVFYCTCKAFCFYQQTRVELWKTVFFYHLSSAHGYEVSVSLTVLH